MTTLKCAACGGPRTGISREIDRTRENALCPECYQATGICACGCGRAIPLYNGHGERRQYFGGECHQNVPELKEQARKHRSQSMKRVWKTRQYRRARKDPARYAKTPAHKLIENRERFKELYHADPDKYLQMTKDWRKNNPEKHAAYERRRHLRKMTNSTLTHDQWQEILKAYNHRCYYCGAPTKKLTQDHIIPLSKGGEHIPQNVVPACMRCNRAKSDGPPPIPVQPVLL